jgi:hypothetical protein
VYDVGIFASESNKYTRAASHNLHPQSDSSPKLCSNLEYTAFICVLCDTARSVPLVSIHIIYTSVINSSKHSGYYMFHILLYLSFAFCQCSTKYVLPMLNKAPQHYHVWWSGSRGRTFLISILSREERSHTRTGRVTPRNWTPVRNA